MLHLMWLASPALPVGGFSYSEGLEAAVDAGLVTDEASAADWLCDQLHLSLARADLPALARALPAWRRDDCPRVDELNQWVLATRETSEFRLQTTQMGRSLVLWLRNLPEPTAQFLRHLDWLEARDPTYPIAFALALSYLPQGSPSHAPVSVRDGLLSYAFGWSENMMQAAIKAMPLGQSAGQRILARMADFIPALCDAAIALPDGSRQAFAPMLAILSARHETQYSRLFRS
jgi:urease accessory protein